MAGRPIARSTEGSLIAQLANRIAALERRRDVSGHYEIKLFADDEVVTVGDGRFSFGIPYNLHRAKLRYVNAYVTTVSTSGLVTVQIHNTGTVASPISLDMLNVPITIDANEKDAEDATTPWEIAGMETPPSYAEYGYPDADNTVFYKQQLRIDIDTAGTGAMGLGLQLGFD